jgi:hypothetical protein
MKKIMSCWIALFFCMSVFAYDSLTVTVNGFNSAGVKITGNADTENIKSKITIDDLKNTKKIAVINKCDSNIIVLCNNYHNQLPIKVSISSVHDSDIQKTILSRQTDFYSYNKIKLDFLQNKRIFDSLIFNNSSAKSSSNQNTTQSQSDPAVTGIPFYDALSISYNGKIDMAQIQKIVQILGFYHDTTGSFSLSDIRNLYETNLFVKDFLNSLKLDTSDSKQVGYGKDFFAGSVVSSAMSNLGGLDVTGLADGMAKFLVKRTKQEMSVAFFNKFRTAINDKYKDMRILFPATYQCFSAIGDQIYNYDAYIQTIRESFEKDLKDLLDNMPSVIKNHPEIDSTDRALLNSGFYFAKSIKNNVHPGRIIRDFPVYESNNIKYLNGAIQTMRIISESVRDTGTSDSASYWVSTEQLQKLLSDSTAFKIYLGLVYQQACSKKAGSGGKELCRILDFVHKSQGKYDKTKEYLSDFCNASDNLSAIINSHKNKSGDSAILQYLNYYISASTSIIRAASSISSIVPNKFSDSVKNIDSTFKRIETVSVITTDILSDIKRKNYSSAIVNSVSLYKLYISAGSDSSKFARSLLKYGTFMATLAQASNSDEVEKTIEAFAMPSGSAALKRHASVDISLNAYTGLFWGREKEISEGSPDKMNYIGGVNAPIGIAFSTSECLFKHLWLFRQYNNIFPSRTIFVSMIDIGAVTAYRFRNDSVDNLPELKLENIIAPGLHIVWGLKDLPVSIGAGVQYGPHLRSVSDSAVVNNKIHGYRWNIFAAVDIPLWNIYSRQKE